jgi:hypothetical protein|tara:strand:- start:5654 stop:5854 length:201 start_codon:yes stop_codon:yes gene_type:complete
VTRVSFQLATAANIDVKNLATTLLGVEKVVERDVSKNAMGRTSLYKNDAASIVADERHLGVFFDPG